MSEHTASRPQIRIVHHADGSAAVNGAAVTVEPGQDVRDAAYRAAVLRVRGAAGPVAATRVEADGTEYPLTLYPARTAFPAAGRSAARACVEAACGLIGRLRVRLRMWLRMPRWPARGTLRRLRTRVPARLRTRTSAPASTGVRVRLRGRVPARLRVRPVAAARLRPLPRWRLRPVLSAGWLVAVAGGCVLLAVSALVLLRQTGPAPVRSTAHSEDEAVRTPVARSIGRGLTESTWRGVPVADTGDRGSGPAAPTASPRAGERLPGAAGSAAAGARGPAGAGAPEPGASQAPHALPGPVPGPRPHPRAADEGPHPQPFAPAVHTQLFGPVVRTRPQPLAPAAAHPQLPQERLAPAVHVRSLVPGGHRPSAAARPTVKAAVRRAH